MYRCAFVLALTTLTAAHAVAQEQVARPFPAGALRGVIAFEAYPDIALNGRSARLAPGSRIRGQDNMIATPASLVGQRWTVNYTVEPTSGLVMDVWVLRRDEMARRPWPTTAEQAASWTFDPVAQTWTRP